MNEPSATAALSHSFPQPDDVNSDDGETQEQRGPEANTGRIRDDPHEVSANEEPPSSGPMSKPQPHIKGNSSSISEGNKSRRGFLTAPTSRHRTLRQGTESTRHSESPRASSFVTAKENLSGSPVRSHASVKKRDAGLTSKSSNGHLISHQEGSSSTASLLHNSEAPATDSPTQESQPKLSPSTTSQTGEHEASPDAFVPQNAGGAGQQLSRAAIPGLIRFNIPEEAHNQLDAKLKSNRADRRRLWRHRHGQGHPGEIVKVEKMLVRMDSTMQDLEADYDENGSLKVETRVIEKWREYVVVCRESTDEKADYSLQLYKTRVIPSIEETKVDKRSAREIPLNRKTTKINLYSSLDKTLAIWVPWKEGRAIYILRPRSAASK